MYRNYSNRKELTRPFVTHFVTSYLTLNCIKQHKNAFRSMFGSEEWATSPHTTKNEAKKVMNLVLSDEKFCRLITYCIKCVNPLIKVVRLVDGDAKSTMYEAMDRVKEKIVRKFPKDKNKV
ncbi:hypothetical protein V8G54_037265 [Vigna mungo]|uniref:Uncharacterized protein n=1 Tax=Vigna mungo TaxID=3915 RepID=A0AAQ3RF87_VIGMU